MATKKRQKPKSTAPKTVEASAVLRRDKRLPDPDIGDAESVEFCDVLHWHGKLVYKCQHCPHTTSNAQEARLHYRQKHAPASPVARNTGLVDRHSRPIAVIEQKEK